MRASRFAISRSIGRSVSRSIDRSGAARCATQDTAFSSRAHTHYSCRINCSASVCTPRKRQIALCGCVCARACASQRKQSPSVATTRGSKRSYLVCDCRSPRPCVTYKTNSVLRIVRTHESREQSVPRVAVGERINAENGVS